MTTKKLAAVIFFVCFAAWLLSWETNTYPEYCKSKDNCPHYNLLEIGFIFFADFAERFQALFIVLLTLGIALFTWQLKVATTGLDNSTKKLWDAGELQRKVSEGALDVAREANGLVRNDSRAWLIFDLVSGKVISQPAKLPFLFTTTHVIQNLGSSPAIDVVVYITAFESSIPFAAMDASDHFLAEARTKYEPSEGRIIYSKLPHHTDNTMGGVILPAFDLPSEGVFLACVVLYRSFGDSKINHTAKVFEVAERRTPEGITIFESFTSAERIS